MAVTKTMSVRKIVHIDEEKCNGCGLCVPSCAEGAIQIIEGKARLVDDKYCDGLGACLGDCPQDAIRIEEREAADFDGKAVEEHLAKQGKPPARSHHHQASHTHAAAHGHGHAGCPSARLLSFETDEEDADSAAASRTPSTLRQWPVQLTLVPPTAPFFQGADLLLTADCVPFAYPDYHRDLLKGKAIAIACPKLDDLEFYVEKLTAIFSQSDVKSVTVAHMEVPCCSGLVYAAKEAIKASGQDIPFGTVMIGIRGERLS